MKPFVNVLASMILAALPALSQAKALTVVNATRTTFSVSLNDHCALIFDYMQPGQQRTASESALASLCDNGQSSCAAKVYPTHNCIGSPIALFSFNVTRGLDDSSTTYNPYWADVNTSDNIFTLYQN